MFGLARQSFQYKANKKCFFFSVRGQRGVDQPDERLLPDPPDGELAHRLLLGGSLSPQRNPVGPAEVIKRRRFGRRL